MSKGRQTHDSLMEGLIDYFKEKGLQIQYARFKDYEKPFEIKRHAPDVIAFSKEEGLAYIGEAKMCSELTDNLTKEQFEDFPKMLMKKGKSEKQHLPFYICVPEECQTKVKETFRNFEIPWKENIQIISV